MLLTIIAMTNKKSILINVNNNMSPASTQTPIHNIPTPNFSSNNKESGNILNKTGDKSEKNINNDISSKNIFVYNQIVSTYHNNREIIPLNNNDKNIPERQNNIDYKKNKVAIKIVPPVQKQTIKKHDTEIATQKNENKDMKKTSTADNHRTDTNTSNINNNEDINKPNIKKTQTKKYNNNYYLQWGAFMGPEPKDIREFERIIKTNPDYLAYFVHWGNGDGKLPAFLKTEARDKGRDLVLFWESSDYTVGGTNQPKFSYKKILNGNWDDYIKDFAKQLKDYKGEVILIPFSELNGNWTPWSGTTNGNTPQEAVEGFRYVSRFFKNIPNVKIGWAVNAASVPDTPENQIENYYPGDEYVDIVGVDGFNDGPPWFSFAEIFDKPLNKLSKYNKPIFIFSFASAEGPNKASWMRDGFFTQMPKYSKLKAWIWFNQDKERNWLIWSDEDSLAVFKEAIGE